MSIFKNVLRELTESISKIDEVNGIFLSGSLANEKKDKYSDIDIGVTTKNSSIALAHTYSQRIEIAKGISGFVHSLDRGWQNCKMIATLYDKKKYPPIGLEIDIIFSQLKHVSEQMPYADYEVLFDKSGELKKKLQKIPNKKSKKEIKKELNEFFNYLPFYVYDATKAHKRGDFFEYQNILEKIRIAVFFVEALTRDSYIYAAKRAMKPASKSRIDQIKTTYKKNSLENVDILLGNLFKYLEDINKKYNIEKDIKKLKRVLLQIWSE